MPATQPSAIIASHPSSAREARSSRTFTVDGDDRLEAHLRTICAVTLDGIKRIVPPEKLQAIWLGGGYGRGEGGVLRTAAGDRPYNDLEFYVCLAGNRFSNRRQFQPALHEFAEEMTPLAEVEVEFHIVSMAELRRPTPNMFYYDLVSGHRQLWGDKNLLAECAHHRDARKLPPLEATRLLMNRGTGLLLAQDRLSRGSLSEADVDFVRRNIAKAQLALGDAVLTAFGEYHWSCRERHQRLRGLTAAKGPWHDEVCEHHAAGVEFKLHPRSDPVSAEELRHEHRRVTALMLPVWLWLERRRLNQKFNSARDYVVSDKPKCPETNSWRNRLVNLRIFGWRALISTRGGRHPRERILRALAILLWDHKGSDRLRDVLLGPGQQPKGSGTVLESYLRLWERVR